MMNLRLLSAFQALEMMQKNNLKKAYGVNRKQARGVLAEYGVELSPRQKVQGRSLEDFMSNAGYEFV
jgi:hypothetical protein|tara:strand:+ start:469 stop:669 length:201 start_codon:yes stop_codon:yes gene_type:complete